jgi:hypothetical protein
MLCFPVRRARAELDDWIVLCFYLAHADGSTTALIS